MQVTRAVNLQDAVRMVSRDSLTTTAPLICIKACGAPRHLNPFPAIRADDDTTTTEEET